MKNILLVLVCTLAMISTAKAKNNCEAPNWEKDFICIIAGGSANTDIALNAGHARSLALKTARLMAYEKMAEKIKGILITSQSKAGNETLTDSEINTALKAKLQNINFEKETVMFLQDGSPWAEVTISMPKFSETTNTVHFENAKSTRPDEVQEMQQNQLLVLDLRGQSFTRIISPKIRNRDSQALIFSMDMLPIGSGTVKYFENEEELAQAFPQANLNLIRATAQADEILVDGQEAQLIKELEFKNNTLSDLNMVILQGN